MKCSWWNFWCRNKAARKLEVQTAVEESNQHLVEDLTVVIKQEVAKLKK